jgi:hypothetical protein
MGAIWRDSGFRETDFWVWRWSHLNVDALSRPSATETPVNPVSILTGFSSLLMREWRVVKLSIKIVCSSVEGQRIDRLRQFDGLKRGWKLRGNSGTATGLSFPSLRSGGKGELHGYPFSFGACLCVRLILAWKLGRCEDIICAAYEAQISG